MKKIALYAKKVIGTMQYGVSTQISSAIKLNLNGQEMCYCTHSFEKSKIDAEELYPISSSKSHPYTEVSSAWVPRNPSIFKSIT